MVLGRFLQVLDREGQMDNPCTSWLSDIYWDNITELDKLTNFHGIMNSFEQYPRDWNLWYTSSKPEKAMLPGQADGARLGFLPLSAGVCVIGLWSLLGRKGGYMLTGAHPFLMGKLPIL